MAREIITLCIGEVGLRFGNNIWKQYGAEHNINNEGIQKIKSVDDTLNAFYEKEEEKKSEKYYPRNLMIDLDPDILSYLNDGDVL